MAAVSLAITGGGALSSFETTVLLSVEETLEALRIAEGVEYRPPASRHPPRAPRGGARRRGRGRDGYRRGSLRSRAVPRLVDTTIRLLSQEPLAGRLPTAEILRVAETLDQAGFACLGISGGGVFDATVRRRVESPWERIRGIKARVSTPLGIALRGRFLVGARA